MSDDPFESELSNLFRAPTGEADPARLRTQVLERMDREDRRRQAVILGASALGATISAAVVGTSGLYSTLAGVLARLSDIMTSSNLEAANPTAAAPWLLAILALGAGAVFAGRAVRSV